MVSQTYIPTIKMSRVSWLKWQVIPLKRRWLRFKFSGRHPVRFEPFKKRTYEENLRTRRHNYSLICHNWWNLRPKKKKKNYRSTNEDWIKHILIQKHTKLFCKAKNVYKERPLYHLKSPPQALGLISLVCLSVCHLFIYLKRE